MVLDFYDVMYVAEPKMLHNYFTGETNSYGKRIIYGLLRVATFILVLCMCCL